MGTEKTFDEIRAEKDDRVKNKVWTEQSALTGCELWMIRAPDRSEGRGLNKILT